MRKLLLAASLGFLLVPATGCVVPAYSGDPPRRTQELLYTSENLRNAQDEWERIWFLDMPSHCTPFAHGRRNHVVSLAETPWRRVPWPRLRGHAHLSQTFSACPRKRGHGTQPASWAPARLERRETSRQVGKGDRHLLCEAPGTNEGWSWPFRQKVPVPFPRLATAAVAGLR